MKIQIKIVSLRKTLNNNNSNNNNKNDNKTKNELENFISTNDMLRDCLRSIEITNKSQPYRVLGFAASDTLTKSITSAAFTFYSTIFSFSFSKTASSIQSL